MRQPRCPMGMLAIRHGIRLNFGTKGAGSAEIQNRADKRP